MPRIYGPLSEEHKAKLSKSLRGKPHNPEWAAKVAAAQRGKPKKYAVHPSTNRKGKTWEEIFGPEKAAWRKERARIRRAAQNSSWRGKTFEQRYGATKAKQVKAKIGAASRLLMQDETRRAAQAASTKAYNDQIPLEERRRRAIARAEGAARWRSQCNRKTLLERLTEAAFEELGLPFIPQYLVGRCTVDLYIPTLNLAVECDGDYWHNLPGVRIRDMHRDQWLRSQGFHVLRLSEVDIKTDPKRAITDYLQTKMKKNAPLRELAQAI